MVATTGDEPNVQLVLPNVSTVARDLMVAELGTIIFNITTAKINVCVVAVTVGAGSWEAVNSS